MPKAKKKSSPLLARIGTNRIAMAFASLGNRFRNLNEQGVHVSASNDNNGHGCNNLQLNPEISIPLPQHPSPKTRTNKKCAENNGTSEVYEASFILTAVQ